MRLSFLIYKKFNVFSELFTFWGSADVEINSIKIFCQKIGKIEDLKKIPNIVFQTYTLIIYI